MLVSSGYLGCLPQQTQFKQAYQKVTTRLICVTCFVIVNLIKREFTIAYIVSGGLMLLIQDLALSEVAEQTTIQPRHDEHTDDAHAG